MCAVGDHGGGVVRVITRTRRQAGQSRAILLWGGINALAVLTNLSRVHAYFQTCINLSSRGKAKKFGKQFGIK